MKVFRMWNLLKLEKGNILRVAFYLSNKTLEDQGGKFIVRTTQPTTTQRIREF
jgi:hypothetical protein